MLATKYALKNKCKCPLVHVNPSLLTAVSKKIQSFAINLCKGVQHLVILISGPLTWSTWLYSRHNAPKQHHSVETSYFLTFRIKN